MSLKIVSVKKKELDQPEVVEERQSVDECLKESLIPESKVSKTVDELGAAVGLE